MATKKATSINIDYYTTMRFLHFITFIRILPRNADHLLNLHAFLVTGK